MTESETKDKDTPGAQVVESGGAAGVGLGTGPEGLRLDSGFRTLRPWEAGHRRLCSTGPRPCGVSAKGNAGRGRPGTSRRPGALLAPPGPRCALPGPDNRVHSHHLPKAELPAWRVHRRGLDQQSSDCEGR